MLKEEVILKSYEKFINSDNSIIEPIKYLYLTHYG